MRIPRRRVANRPKPVTKVVRDNSKLKARAKAKEVRDNSKLKDKAKAKEVRDNSRRKDKDGEVGGDSRVRGHRHRPGAPPAIVSGEAPGRMDAPSVEAVVRRVPKSTPPVPSPAATSASGRNDCGMWRTC